jgi:hypothetical protein
MALTALSRILMRVRAGFALAALFASSGAFAIDPPAIPSRVSSQIEASGLNRYQRAALHYYAEARIFAADARRDEAREAEKHLRASRACLSRDFQDEGQRTALVADIDAAIPMASGIQEETDLKRGEGTEPDAGPVDVCPLTAPGDPGKTPADPWRWTARAGEVEPLDRGIDESIANALRAHLASLGLAPSEFRALEFYGVTQAALAGSLQGGKVTMEAWYTNRNAEVCLSRDIPDEKRAHALADDVVAFLGRDRKSVV